MRLKDEFLAIICLCDILEIVRLYPLPRGLRNIFFATLDCSGADADTFRLECMLPAQVMHLGGLCFSGCR